MAKIKWFGVKNTERQAIRKVGNEWFLHDTVGDHILIGENEHRSVGDLRWINKSQIISECEI